MGIQLTDLLIKECITIDTTLTLTLTLTDTVMVMLCVNRPSRAQRLDSLCVRIENICRKRVELQHCEKRCESASVRAD